MFSSSLEVERNQVEPESFSRHLEQMVRHLNSHAQDTKLFHCTILTIKQKESLASLNNYIPT
jgi:hypothetical protein